MNENLIPINPAEPIENTIRFVNTISGDNVEVLRISKDGITANPDVPVDDAAKAVLRAVDGYIKQITQRTWIGLTDEERGQIYSSWRFNGINSTNLELCRDIEAKLKEKNT